jgi:hypothetical protein
MLLRLVLADMPPAAPRWIIPHGHAETAAELYQAILFDLGLPYQGRSPQELRLAVWDVLISTKRPVLLIVDEAQHLGVEAIEEIRLLTNFSTPQGGTVVPLLAGQLGLMAKLRQPELVAFTARVSHLCQLEPWGEEESLTFLRWHWNQATLPIEDEALQWIARVGQGNAHRLVQLSLHAEQLAQRAEAASVDSEAVWEAIHHLGVSVTVAEDSRGADWTEHVLEGERTTGESTGRLSFLSGGEGSRGNGGEGSRGKPPEDGKDQVADPIQTKEVIASGDVSDVEAA